MVEQQIIFGAGLKLPEIPYECKINRDRSAILVNSIDTCRFKSKNKKK